MYESVWGLYWWLPLFLSQELHLSRLSSLSAALVSVFLAALVAQLTLHPCYLCSFFCPWWLIRTEHGRAAWESHSSKGSYSTLKATNSKPLSHLAISSWKASSTAFRANWPSVLDTATWGNTWSQKWQFSKCGIPGYLKLSKLVEFYQLRRRISMNFQATQGILVTLGASWVPGRNGMLRWALRGQDHLNGCGGRMTTWLGYDWIATTTSDIHLQIRPKASKYHIIQSSYSHTTLKTAARWHSRQLLPKKPSSVRQHHAFQGTMRRRWWEERPRPLQGTRCQPVSAVTSNEIHQPVTQPHLQSNKHGYKIRILSGSNAGGRSGNWWNPLYQWKYSYQYVLWQFWGSSAIHHTPYPYFRRRMGCSPSRWTWWLSPAAWKSITAVSRAWCSRLFCCQAYMCTVFICVTLV